MIETRLTQTSYSLMTCQMVPKTTSRLVNVFQYRHPRRGYTIRIAGSGHWAPNFRTSGDCLGPTRNRRRRLCRSDALSLCLDGVFLVTTNGQSCAANAIYAASGSILFAWNAGSWLLAFARAGRGVTIDLIMSRRTAIQENIATRLKKRIIKPLATAEYAEQFEEFVKRLRPAQREFQARISSSQAQGASK